MRDVRDILQDIRVHIDYLEQFIAEGHDQFINDVKTQFAVRLAYEVIGDMVKQLPAELLKQQPHIRWRDLKGMRDVLAHQYFQLDLEEIWQATQDLLNLRAAVQALLDALPPDE